MKFPALLQKIGVFAIVVTTLVSLVAPLASAQEYAPIPPLQENTLSTKSITNPDVPDNMNTRAQVAFIQFANTIMCQLTGYDMLNNNKPCLTLDFNTGKIGYAQPEDPKRIGGLIGQVTLLIGSTYNMPIHGSDYTQYLADNFGFAPKTYAQNTGTGYNSLKPLLNLWTRIRDLCYLAFVVLFVLVGFGIMMRIKIDPRTVMSIQNQIPKIIIAILLITFSYAIAGFLIDAMWTITYVGINILTADTACAGGNSLTATATNNLLTTPLTYVSRLFSDTGCVNDWGISELSYNVGWALGEVITSGFGALFSGQNQQGGSCVSWTGVDFGQCINEMFTWVFTRIFGILATLVIFIAILVQLVRVWFALIKAYFYVIMYTILGPFYILFGLIPGTQSFGFEQWLRYMVSALAMFPATAFIFIAAVILANNQQMNSPSATDHFVPPLLGNPSLSNNIGMLVALGAILISPEVVNMMRNAFKASPSKYTPQIFKGLGSGIAPVQGGAGRGWGYMTRSGDAATGDKGGIFRQWIQGDPSKYYQTNQYGQKYADYSKTTARFKLGEMFLGKSK